MTHDILYDFQIALGLTEPRTKGVPNLMTWKVRYHHRFAVCFGCLYLFLGIMRRPDTLNRFIDCTWMMQTAIVIDKNKAEKIGSKEMSF